jgi:hypothetical protein
MSTKERSELDASIALAQHQQDIDQHVVDVQFNYHTQVAQAREMAGKMRTF